MYDTIRQMWHNFTGCVWDTEELFTKRPESCNSRWSSCYRG